MSETEQLIFERQLEISQRIHEWRLENKRLGMMPNLTDTWTPEQSERQKREWRDDEILMRGQKHSYEETEEPQFEQGQDDDDNGIL